MDRRHAALMFDRLADLPLEIERYSFEELSAGERITVLLRLEGGGHEGVGEDVMQVPGQPVTFSGLTSMPLAGSWTLSSFIDALPGVDQWGGDGPSDEWGDFGRRLRNWTFEAAALDLALRQASLTLPEALGREVKPVRFVNSMPLGDEPSVETVLARLAVSPTVGFKLDAAPEWTRELVAELAATGAVRTVDFKGRYGLELKGDIAPVYEWVIELLPEALIEDPHEAFAALVPIERLSYDAPIVRPEDVGTTRTINVKPSRIGGLRPLFDIYAHCAAEGVAMYGGGMGELGIGREQIQLLAAIFHPDGPNDVAPPPFNLPEPIPGLPASPLAVGSPPIGFRLK